MKKAEQKENIHKCVINNNGRYLVLAIDQTLCEASHIHDL